MAPVNDKSPFFKPSLDHRMVIVHKRTPGGRTITTTQPKDGEKKAGLLGTTSNLVNAIVGCGIVGIPYAVQRSGFAAGVCLILLVAALTEKSLRLLVNTAKHVHVGTYELLAKSAFGLPGFRFIAINMFIVAYGAMVSYLLIIKQSLGTLVFGDDEILISKGQDPIILKRTVLLIVSLGVAYPLACKRDVASLSATSKLNVFIDTALVGLVAYNAPFMASHSGLQVDGTVHHYNMWIHTNTIFVGLGVLSFAFVCQHSSFIIAGSLENPTVKRWSQVTGYSLCLCAVLSLLCGVTGYLGYRENTQGNILENLDSKSVSANIARGMLGVTMCCVYPLESFVTRHVLVVLLFSGHTAEQGDDSLILDRRDRRVGLTTLLYIMAVVPALLANDLGIVLAITGAIGGSCLAYIGPGLVYLGVHGERFLQLAQHAWRHSSDNRIATAAEEGIVVISPETLDSPAVAVETTPLVACGNSRQDGFDGIFAFDESFVVKGSWNKLTWYMLGMPLWCFIAKCGKARLQQHIHELAIQSPHPIRIGDVEYSRLIIQMSGKEDLGTRLQQLYRANSLKTGDIPNVASFSKINTLSASSHGGVERSDINRQIGQELLAQQKQNNPTKSSKLEQDPQEQPPSWVDFYIAICFILLGAVALVAGIGSIFMQSN